jgi:hypothetical protein
MSTDESRIARAVQSTHDCQHGYSRHNTQSGGSAGTHAESRKTEGEREKKELSSGFNGRCELSDNLGWLWPDASLLCYMRARG